MNKNPKETLQNQGAFKELKDFFEKHPSIEAGMAMSLITHEYYARRLTLQEYQSLIADIQFKVFSYFVNFINTFPRVSKESWQLMIKEAHQADHISTEQRITLLKML